MTRNEYLDRERDMLLKAYTTATEDEKREIMLKIMSIDTQSGRILMAGNPVVFLHAEETK